MYSSGCPTLEQFEDLMANRFSPSEAEAVRNHLFNCSSCSNKINGTTKSRRNFPFLSPPKEKDELGWLGVFKILGVLGEGGMAVVFDAEDTTLHRRVALKVLHPELSDSSIRERFLREARLLASVTSDYVVRIYQVGEANGIPYLVMEKLTGMSLENRLEQDGRLPLGDTLSILRQAAEGLQVAHEHGLIHRDIKPANLWLEKREGKHPRLKLIDFGIARHMYQNSNLTTKGQVLGTPVYMSPEQAMGLPVDARTDLYSLGGVLYHMITGEPPIGTNAELQHHLRQINEEKDPLKSGNAFKIPDVVANLIQQLMHTDPKERPMSAEALAQNLRTIEDQHPDSVVMVPSLSGNSGTLPQRNSSRLGVILGIAILLLALLVGALAMTYKVLYLMDYHSKQPSIPEGKR